MKLLRITAVHTITFSREEIKIDNSYVSRSVDSSIASHHSFPQITSPVHFAAEGFSRHFSSQLGC